MVDPLVAGEPGQAAGPGGDAGPGDERALCPRLQTVWRWLSALVTAVLVGAGTLLAALTTGPLRATVVALTVVVATVGVLEVTVFVPLRYRRWRYRLGPATLDLRYGVLTRRASTVPYVRIQHIDLTAGPLDRRLDLTRLAIRTASASTLATLPGIDRAEAERLRATILQRAGLDDAV